MDVTQLLAILGLLFGGGSAIGVVVVELIRWRAKKPQDDNEASKLAKEWYRDMLADAKAEREELRQTIEELRGEKVSAEKSVARLEELLSKKDERITELERRRDSNVAKLQAGMVLTLGDVLGTDTPLDGIPAVETTPKENR